MRSTFLFSFILLIGLLAHPSVSWSKNPKLKEKPAPQAKVPAWTSLLRKRMTELNKQHPGQVGLYVKDTKKGESFSFQGEDPWYIASGVKVPIAIEVLRKLDQTGESLDQTLIITKADYLDGAGETNYIPAGKSVTLRFLLEQMLTKSDNTASDILIRYVGLKKINDSIEELVPKGFSPITTLLEVRKLAFSEFHIKAYDLSGLDFIRLRAIPDEKLKLQKLEQILKIESGQFKAKSLDEAYNSYYRKNFNTATLKAYADLLEKVATQSLLKPTSKDFLIQTMLKTKTGQGRLKAGLPDDILLAHKTGTQRMRICDFGWTWKAPRTVENSVIVAACSRDFPTFKEAEKSLRDMGQMIHESGVLDSTEAKR